MADTAIVVINGYKVIHMLEEQYIQESVAWKVKCAAVRAGFKQKTSKTIKNSKGYESTSWYMVKPDGGLKSVGKEEPDYSKYYPPEPKPAYSFKFQRYQDHIVLEEKDYLANQKLFEDCLVFALEECRNYSHPLYANPQKAVNGHNTGLLCSNAEKDGGGACSHLRGMNCGVLCCRQCPDDCASRCAVADSVRKGAGISARSADMTLSPEAKREHERRTAEINQAYDAIKKERGI
jgi:hypothetical protein